MTDFHAEAKSLGIEILGAESFVGNPDSKVENIKVGYINMLAAQIQQLHKEWYSIII